MSFLDTTKANIAFKLALGKTHTNNNREVFNEPQSTQAIVLGQYAWGEKVHPSNPTDASNSGIVSELLTLNLTAVSGTDGTGKYSAYYCSINGTVPSSLSGKINPLTGVAYQNNDRIGNFIPASVHSNYRPKLYKSGVETTPLDASDWFVDCYSGTVIQETDVPASMLDYSTGGTLTAYVYIGKTISDALTAANAAATSISFYDKQTVGSGITGTVNGINDTFTLAHVPTSGSEHLFVNGVLQNPGATADYTITGASIVFNTDAIPRAGDILIASYRTTA
jgi:hypothetical protein